MQADPEVKKVKLQVEHLDLVKLGELSTLEEEDYSESLLYTEEDVRKLENLISFGPVKERALHTLVNSFCNGDGNCGSYKPSCHVSHLDFTHLEDRLDSPLSWLVGTWTENLERVGAYGGLVLMLGFMSYAAWKTARKVCSHMQQKNSSTMQVGTTHRRGRRYPRRTTLRSSTMSWKKEYLTTNLKANLCAHHHREQLLSDGLEDDNLSLTS